MKVKVRRFRDTDYLADRNGNTYSDKFGKIRKLKPIKCNNGYLYVNIHQDGNRHLTLVSRLVLECFVGPCPESMECRHLNGNKLDNRLKNLVWGTRKENCADKVKHGISNRGGKNGNAKLTEDDVREIRLIYKYRACTQREIADLFGISRGSISDIVNKINWKHIR